MPKKAKLDIWGNEIPKQASSLPPGCSFERSKLEVDEEGRLTRTFYNESGNMIHHIKGTKIYDRTKIDVSPTLNPREYHRIYYRNIRRYRDNKYKPRLPDL